MIIISPVPTAPFSGIGDRPNKPAYLKVVQVYTACQ